MDFINYYSVLGLAEPATPAAIKMAYRKLARKFHPDVSKEQDADARFKALGEAYAVLKDANKRTEYDLARASRSAGGKRNRAVAGAAGGDHVVSRKCQDFAKSSIDADKALGKRGRGRNRPTADYIQKVPVSQRGKDLHHRLVLTLEEALLGSQRTLKLELSGVGALGPLRASSKTVTVKIPAGVVPGQRIRLAGQGRPGCGGGLAGDYLLEIQLAPHPLFVVVSRDVLISLPVANWEVALGARIEVPTLTGPVKLTIPKETVSGSKLRLKGKGLGLNPTGDLIVHLEVMVPERHWTKAEMLYREIADM